MAAACAGSDVVVHAAGLTRSADPSAFTRVNVAGTRAVAGAANTVGARMIYISSQAALGASAPGGESAEDDPPRPLNAYGRSKLEAEQVVRAESRLPWTILRPSSVYGPRDRQFLPLFREAARGRFWLVGGAGMSLTLVHVRDLAAAVVLAAEPAFADGRGVPDWSSAAGDDRLTCCERSPMPSAGVIGRSPSRGLCWPQRLLRASSRGVSATQPLVDRTRLAELSAGSFVCSVARARAQLGFTAATDLREGMAETWQWYRAAGWA